MLTGSLPTVFPSAAGPSAIVTASATVNAHTVVPNATSILTNMLGVNLVYWDSQMTTAQTQQMVTAAELTMYRFPGGSAADGYHFNTASNWGDSAADTLPQFAQFIAAVGGTGVVTLDYGSGSPQEAEAELAYLMGAPTDTTPIGNGLEWNDTASAWQTVNWQTVGYWAGLRAATPLVTDDGLNFLRINHAAAYSAIKYWEVGNEDYGSWEVDHHGTAGPGGVATGTAHDPATYVKFSAAFASFVTADQVNLPSILIGIDSGDPTGTADNHWTQNVLSDGVSHGFTPGFISDHSYMQEPGAESDSFLLNNTVSNPGSVLDWSTRYGDYEALLQQTLGSSATKNVQVMATEFNSVSYNPGKQSTSLVNGLFIADSLGSLLDSGYTAGLVWDLRNSFDAGQNNASSLYGWRTGGDYGLLGDSNTSNPPNTGPYVAYPGYFAEQLVAQIARSGGHAISALSDTATISIYSVLETDGHLDLLVINKNPSAAANEHLNITGFQASGQAQFWQYGQIQDSAQSQSPNGASALANFSASLNLSGGNFSYSFPAYSMTVVDLSPTPPSPPMPTPVSTTTTVTSSNTTPTYGSPVTFKARLNPASGSGLTGNVQFQIDGSNVGSPVPLSGDTATCTLAALTVGSHTVVALYSGDANFLGSTSPALTQSVGPAYLSPLAPQTGKAQSFFDESYYLLNNPDVAAAVKAGGFASGWLHFLAFGQYEGRSPSTLFNEAYYLSNNPDVAAAVKNHQFVDGFQHFVNYGYMECRPGSATPSAGDGTYVSTLAPKSGIMPSFFDEDDYLALYPDVRKAIHDGWFASGWAHFLAFGQFEGRRPSTLFNEQDYLARYPDVAAAVRNHQFADGFQHFVLFGYTERRIGT